MKEMYGIDFKEELKIYKSASKGQIKNITYSGWKNHIIELLSDLNASELEDLRHLCLYREKGEHHGINIFMALIALLIPNYIGYILKDSDPNAFAAYGVLATVITLFIAFDYFRYTVSESFYHEMHELVETTIKSNETDKKTEEVKND